MGLFDSVYADCPRCGRKTEFQSKADSAPYMNNYTIKNAPAHILEDVMNWPRFCSGCKTWFALIDPAFPPNIDRPRPNPQPELVREPGDGEYCVHSSHPDQLRWWEADFSFSDLVKAEKP